MGESVELWFWKYFPKHDGFGAAVGQLRKASACRELSLQCVVAHSTTIGRSRGAMGVRLPLVGFTRDLTLHDRQFDVGLFESDLATL